MREGSIALRDFEIKFRVEEVFEIVDNDSSLFGFFSFSLSTPGLIFLHLGSLLIMRYRLTLKFSINVLA